MKLIIKHKKLIIILLLILSSIVFITSIIIINRHIFIDEGVIEIVFIETGSFDYPMCVMNIEPDGSVTTTLGKRSFLINRFGIGVPIFTKEITSIESSISEEDYIFLRNVIYKKDRPNLKGDIYSLFGEGYSTTYWVTVVSTKDRSYRLFSDNFLRREEDNIVDQFYEKIWDICPIELYELINSPNADVPLKEVIPK